jgi:hypothetical protein
LPLKSSILLIGVSLRVTSADPADADAVLLEFFFEEALVLEHHGDRIVGRPIDTDFRGLPGGARETGRHQGCGCGRDKQVTA